MPFLHSSGTVPEFQTMLNRWQSSCAISGPPCFSTSGVMLSIPGALFFFSVLIAFKTSVILISSVFFMRQATSDPQHGIPWNTRRLTDLDFADDLALLGENAKSLQSMTDNLAITAAKVGLRISTEKTKVMSVREQQPLALK